MFLVKYSLEFIPLKTNNKLYIFSNYIKAYTCGISYISYTFSRSIPIYNSFYSCCYTSKIGGNVNIHLYNLINSVFRFRITSLLNANGINKITYIRGDYHSIRGNNLAYLKYLKETSSKLNIYLPIYTEFHSSTISTNFEIYRNTKKVSFSKAYRFITQSTFDILSILSCIKVFNINKRNIYIGIPIILKRECFFRFIKLCGVKLPLWIKKFLFKSDSISFQWKLIHILEIFISSLKVIGFTKLQFFTMNHIESIDLFFKETA
ncbi:methylenetetrahydrofolate reductase [Candidatus Vidania fulgoroideae]|uniref:Methylenetetrahydrofolate reductase n=1 Tax=Candidatus Vidania fulgoroideorum TaxID=881286 RepID=A0A974X7J4_9PROT|nr:methylenetetrahydrofolate reductase [Candidatus Vidania fulgoroideae]